jgi:hypothetical protein
MPIPSDGTTTNGERPRWITLYQKTSIYLIPMSKFVSPKKFHSNKSAKNLKDTSEVRPDCTQIGSSG